MINPIKMAWLHLTRKKLQSIVMIMSLAMALTGSGLLLRLYQISESRFNNMATNIQIVVGPKCGGIEILLGALNLEDRCQFALPLNLFETLKNGTDLRFEDGAVISSAQITKNVIPMLQVGHFQSSKVIATDESFFRILKLESSAIMNFPSDNGLLIGAKAAELYHLHTNENVEIELRNNNKKVSLKVAGILPEQSSGWDYGFFLRMESGWDLLRQSGYDHPIWHNKILSFFLIQMQEKGFLPLKSLINDRSVAQIIWVNEEKKNLEELSGSAGNLGLAIIVVILCLAGFSIFGMMSIRSEGLRVSAATLEAIGFQHRFIFTWMILESVIIGLFSSTLAVVLEFISFAILKNMLSSTWLIPAHQSSGSFWILILFIQGIAFSLIGSASSILQLVRVSVHQELKSG